MPSLDNPALDASALAAWLADFAAAVAQHEAELTDLDRRIGDADHGTNLHRGMTAVAALPSEGTAADYAKKVAMTLISTVGGASGPLYGTFFLRLAAALPPDGPITAAQWVDALAAGIAGVAARGKADPGDKTMLDALFPALDAFRRAVEAGTADAAWRLAAEAAASGRDATIDLVARKGRASYLGERSRGTADPGSASATLLVQSAARTLTPGGTA